MKHNEILDKWYDRAAKIEMKHQKKHRDQETFNSFKEYWDNNQEQRFFQALRNWIGCGFLRADGKDTFYWEGYPK